VAGPIGLPPHPPTLVWHCHNRITRRKRNKHPPPLPESQALPSAKELCRVFYIGHSAKDVFAECPNSNTRQRHDPRQSWSLPSAQDRHSTKTFSLPSAQICHSAKTFFAECQRLTLGKFWPAVKPACGRQLFAECTNATLGKEALCRVSKADTRQSIIFFLTPALQNFSPLHIPHVVLHA